jgi:exodeoxyribonuclease VII large subunit
MKQKLLRYSYTRLLDDYTRVEKHGWLTASFLLGMLRSMELLAFTKSGPRVWTVSEVNRYVRQSLETDYRLQDLWISGEMRDLTRPTSGHLYFSLVDERASLRCVIWRSEADGLLHSPQEGEGVEVHGYVGLYEAGGQYQLYADEIRPAGEGALFAEYLRLKTKLEAEGLFDPAKKRELPLWPRKIGVITSRTGAALQDVLTVLRRRFPLLTIFLVPATVQGVGAPPEIVQAFEFLNSHAQSDLILLVRGGGSMEDLQAFNDERVVRAVASSGIPVVTGIGHETDILLADLAADLRAATPTAAAEMVTPDREELLENLNTLCLGLHAEFGEILFEARNRLKNISTLLRQLSPRAQVINLLQRIDDQEHALSAAVQGTLSIRQAEIQGFIKTLEALNPLGVLGRGFALVRKEKDGSVVRLVDQVKPKDRLRVRVQDGEFIATADEDEQNP